MPFIKGSYKRHILSVFLNDLICKAANLRKCTKEVVLNKSKCLANEIERQHMKDVSYASVVGSLMYALVGTRPNITLVVRVLGRFFSNPRMERWVAIKKVMRYL